jgi:hypothetical protein
LQNIIVNLVNWKERDRKNNKEQAPAKEDSISSTVGNLVSALLVTQLRQMNQPQHYPPLPCSNFEPPCNSSPVRLETDPIELLGQFFDWLVSQPGFNSKQQRVLLEPIKEKLMEDQWNIDSFKPRKLDEGITIEIWETYGFKIGLLARIKSKVSDFKRSRE